jgi:hypothetical protein
MNLKKQSCSGPTCSGQLAWADGSLFAYNASWTFNLSIVSYANANPCFFLNPNDLKFYDCPCTNTGPFVCQFDCNNVVSTSEYA